MTGTIKKEMKDAIKIKGYSAEITCGANTLGYATANALNMSTPSGYTPIGIIGFSSDSTCPVFSVSATATGAQGALWARNVTATTRTFTVTMSVAYIRTDLIEAS